MDAPPITIAHAATLAAERLRASAKSLAAVGLEAEGTLAAHRALVLARWGRGDPIGLAGLAFAMEGVPLTGGGTLCAGG